MLCPYSSDRKVHCQHSCHIVSCVTTTINTCSPHTFLGNPTRYCHKQGHRDLLSPFQRVMTSNLNLIWVDLFFFSNRLFVTNQSNKDWIFVMSSLLCIFFQCPAWKTDFIVWKQLLSPLDCIPCPWKVRLHSYYCWPFVSRCLDCWFKNNWSRDSIS